MAQAKRSPILGYNHNVKYRGVIFHVQTEDSGQQNPHLFTHLFHEGVIVSTRKYVYDAGSNEDAIKGLMQAQHKAVMKDLRRGAFDDKIDAYLSGTPGLEPRAGADASAAPLPRGERAKTEADPNPPVTASSDRLEIVNDELSEPIELPLKARTESSDKTRPVELPRDVLPPPTPEPPAEQEPPPVKARTSTAQKFSRSSGVPATPPAGTPRPVAPVAAAAEPLGRAKGGGEPLLEITEDEISSRLRGPRDTNIEMVDEVGDGIPRGGGDSVPPATTPVRSDRPAAHGAAALPASKPPSRPGIPPTRPATGEPGEERAGTYSVSRKSGDAPIREKTGRVPAIAPATPAVGARPAGRPASEQPGGGRVQQPGSGPNRIPQSVPIQTPAAQTSRAATPPPPPAGQRPMTPQQIRPSVTAPIANRSATPANPQPGSGVVMTRPAVVVGAQPKPASQTTQRVRKAREDEGRGFGQGLISEKSLDEVILAYLSEDAEDK